MKASSSARKHSVITVAICFLIAVIEGLDIQAAGIAAAGIREHFALDSSQLGVFFSAGILVAMIVTFTIKIKLFGMVTSYISGMFQ